MHDGDLETAHPTMPRTAVTETDHHAASGGFQPTVRRALERAKGALLSQQHEDGYWVGELQGDSILESEYILLRFILGQDDDPDLPLITNHLRRLQEPNGGWSLFPGGEPDRSGTVKGYFCLKLMGDDPEAPHMRRARELIRAMGGAEQCNTFTRFYLACLGQISFDACPSIPPEIVFLPRWFYFNLYNMSAWTRTMVLPLGIVTTQCPVRDLPTEKRIDELYLDRAAANRLADPPRALPRTWRDFFLRLDQMLKWYEKRPIRWLRRRALRAAERWLVARHEGSEGLGAIFPPMVYMLIVLRVLGYRDDHPLVRDCHRYLRDFFIREDDAIRIQPCLSPVWDTGLTLHALAEAGLDPEAQAARKGTAWLLEKECRNEADWCVKCPGVEPSGWFFEFANPHYPDTDDTAMALTALRRLGGEQAQDAIGRGVNWLLAMQNNDGGWAAFDRTKDRPILEAIPFADHNAMQDPSCPDITGRVLEGLGHNGLTVDHPAVRRAALYLRRQQDASGAWWGRWGVNYIYGTWQVLTGLRAVGEAMTQDYTRRAAEWLRSVQKPDGSFGETCDSYADPSLKGQGETTASQTAWGAMGLMAVAGADDRDVERAVRWLVENQADDGAWEEAHFTGTGFPEVFYLKYHLYRLYFPVTALARYLRLTTTS